MQTASEFVLLTLAEIEGDAVATTRLAIEAIEARDREVRLDELRWLYGVATNQPRAFIAGRIAELEAERAGGE